MYQYVKRLLDIVMASVALILLAPLFFVIIVLIQMDSEGPVLFHQKRYGKNRTFFYIKKFRTMRIDTPEDVPTHLMVNPDDYITKVGRILRKTSLDELPQLWNILKGEMRQGYGKEISLQTQ